MKNTIKLNRKKMCFVFLLIIAVSVTAFAHDKGDLMLNIEIPIGYIAPDIGIKVDGDSLKDAYDLKESHNFGMNIGFLGTVHYYFFDMLGVNTGLGLNFLFNSIQYKEKGGSFYDSVTFSSGGLYLTIPAGVRFSKNILVLGAGITANIPLLARSTITFGQDPYFEDEKFKLDSYMGWYFDIGFDNSGKENQAGGFGMQVRFSAPFSNKIGNTSNFIDFGGGYEQLSYSPFSHLNISIVFQAAIELSNIPIK